MGKFVSQNNLSYFWQKIKTLLSSKADKSEIPDTSNFATTNTAQTLYKKSFNQVTINVGTSSTASSTATKVVTLSNFELKTGAIIDVTFSNGSYYDNGATTGLELSLNVNSTGAKKIINYTSSGATNNYHSKNNYRKWNAGDTVRFRYDGTYWTLVANLTTMTSYLAPVFRFPLRYNKSDGSSTYWYGTENLDLTHLLPSSVQYVSQTLTDAQKTQARTNIGAGTSNFSGDYNDLSNKPTIPDTSGLLKLDGSNTMTGKLNLKASGNNEGNIGANGIRWNSDSLPEDTAPQYICTIDGFANGGRQKWASLANLKSALGVPTNTNQLTNGAGFVTSSGSVANATKLNNQDASYYLNYNNLSNKPTIPTNTNQLTNGAGFITSSSLGTQATFSLSGTTLTITPK